MSAGQFKPTSQASRWVKSLVVHGSVLAALVAWKYLGYEWAGNVVIFWLWIVAITGTVWALVPEKNKPAKLQRNPPFLRAFNFSALLLTIGSVVAFGHYVLGGFLVFGLLGSMRDLTIYNEDGYKREPQ